MMRTAKHNTKPAVVYYQGAECLVEEYEAVSWEPSESWLPAHLWHNLLSRMQVDRPLDRACMFQGVMRLFDQEPIMCCERVNMQVWPLTWQNKPTIRIAIGQCPVCRRIHWACDSRSAVAVRVPGGTVLVNGPPRRME